MNKAAGFALFVAAPAAVGSAIGAVVGAVLRRKHIARGALIGGGVGALGGASTFAILSERAAAQLGRGVNQGGGGPMSEGTRQLVWIRRYEYMACASDKQGSIHTAEEFRIQAEGFRKGLPLPAGLPPPIAKPVSGCGAP